MRPTAPAKAAAPAAADPAGVGPALRVLHVGKYFPPVAGGIESFCGDLYQAFENSPVRCAMLVHRKAGQDFPQRPDLTGVASRGEFFFTPVAPGFASEIRRQLRRFRPRLLHLHLPNPITFALLAMNAARDIPWVIHWHSDVLASRHQWRLRLAYPAYRVLEAALLRRAAAVVATSEAYLSASPVLSAMDRQRLHVLPFGIDPDRLRERRPVAWPPGAHKIAAVGRLTYYKGFDRLLTAMQSLPEACLLLLGDGQERSRLQQQIAALGLQSRVRLVRDASDALRNSVIASADCLCLPSVERTEAFGIVLVEAMALGTPVVATNIPGSGVPFVVNRGGHGLLAEPDSVESLLAKLRQLLNDPELRAKLGRRALENFADFHISRTAERLTDLYQRLC